MIVTGDAAVHVRSIAEHIEETVEEETGQRPNYREGLKEGTWAVLDYGDVVIHLFVASARSFYALEKLWGDAPVELVRDEPKRRRTTAMTEQAKDVW